MDRAVSLPDKWREWEITEKIGTGSYGSMYKAQFVPDGSAEPGSFAALKIIEIPYDENEANAIAREHPDREERTVFYEGLIESILEEIHVMERLRDNPNAVALQAYHISHEEEFKWTIFIRMELLTPFAEYRFTEEIDEERAIQLGIDICNILEECAEYNIIHRDIKPENILVDDEGRFKLGDFGIARRMELTAVDLSLKGTFAYMAPEVYHGETYDARADQYSLGIVLYRIMNNNRDPLIPADTQMVSFKDREEALRERMDGEVLPNPPKASETFGRIIRKACSFRAENRFEKISLMKDALERCLRGEDFSISNLVEVSEVERLEMLRLKRKRRRILLVALIIAAAAVLLVCVVRMQTGKTDDEIMIEESRSLENNIKETGIRKDNALKEVDISEVSERLDALNVSPEADEVLGIIDKYETEAKAKNEDGRGNFDQYASSLFYLEDDTALGLSVNYHSAVDEVTNTEQTRDMYTLYYLTKTGGSWERHSSGEVPEGVWEKVYETCLPEKFADAFAAGRNHCDYLDAYWACSDAFYESGIALVSGALWQNEDGSADVYMIVRNGTSHPCAEYAYWNCVEDENKGEIVKAWGHLDPGEVGAEASGISGYILHYDADEVISGTAPWTPCGVWNYTSGNNSNYE